MNKKELIKHFEDTPYVSISQMGKKSFIDLIEKLDEPQKPVVQQFVADWYEEHKDDFEGNLFRCIDRMPDLFSGEELSDFEEWIVDDDTAPFQTLVNMHQFGYEVEKEKRYLVKMKGISSNMCYLNRVGNKWIIAGIDEHTGMNIYTKHTKKELEDASFGWVFDCPGIEIEEVEDE